MKSPRNDKHKLEKNFRHTYTTMGHKVQIQGLRHLPVHLNTKHIGLHLAGGSASHFDILPIMMKRDIEKRPMKQ